jgi:hypothetical protein
VPVELPRPGARAFEPSTTVTMPPPRQDEARAAAEGVRPPAAPAAPAAAPQVVPTAAAPVAPATENAPAAPVPTESPAAAFPALARAPASTSTSTSTTASTVPAAAAPSQPAPGAEAASETAPVHIANPPASLRVTVDGVPAQLPLRLARRPGRYRLRFESPGRQPQSVVVDGMAPSHEVRLHMPRRRDPDEAMSDEDRGPDLLAPSVTASPPAPVPSPEPPAEAPRTTRQPSLIEDVDDAPVPVQ